MNKIIFTIVWGCLIWVLAACEDENPGYLFSEQAAYPEDSLVVLTPASLQQAITEMQQAKDDFQRTEEGRKLYQQMAELEAKREAEDLILNGEDGMSGETGILYELQDQINYDEETYEPIEDDIYRAWVAQKAVCDSIEGIIWDIDYMYIPDIEKQIEASIGNIDTEIVLFQRRLDNNVAYTTSSIDQIKGTAPLLYSIAAVKPRDGGDADKFSGYLSVMGSGRLLIRWDENIPVGRYVISLYVENEGWKNLLADIFTIIVK